MADDTRRDEEELKITVRDRRRVTLEGELREVEEDEAPAPRPTPPPPPPPAEPQTQRPRGGGLGGAEEARVRRDTPHLQEVPIEDEYDDDDEMDAQSGGPRQPRDLYEYTQMLALGMIEWSLSATGLAPNPITRIVTTDMPQAEFGVEAAERLYDLLVEKGKIAPELRMGFCQSYIINFGQIAAQLLRQPPGVRLQEMGKVRFCIDTADRFMTKLREVPGAEDQAQLEEIQAFLSEVRLSYIQLSGGGGIIG